MLKQSIQRLSLIGKSLMNAKLDALDRLRADHLRVEMQLLRARAVKDEKKRKQIFRKVKTELLSHMHAEETVFYPVCEKIEKLKPAVHELREEHKRIKKLIDEFEAVESESGEKWEPKWKALVGGVDSYLALEEHTLFPKARRAISRDDLEVLGEELQSAKRHKAAA